MHPALRKNPLFYKKTPPLFTFFTKHSQFFTFYKKTPSIFHFFNKNIPSILFSAYGPDMDATNACNSSGDQCFAEIKPPCLD